MACLPELVSCVQQPAWNKGMTFSSAHSNPHMAIQTERNILHAWCGVRLHDSKSCCDPPTNSQLAASQSNRWSERDSNHKHKHSPSPSTPRSRHYRNSLLPEASPLSTHMSQCSSVIGIGHVRIGTVCVLVVPPVGPFASIAVIEAQVPAD